MVQKVTQVRQQPRRGIAISSFSQASATGVWSYRVDVSVYEGKRASAFINGSEDVSADENFSDTDSLSDTSSVEHYSILRRYNDSLQLNEQVRVVVNASEKEY
ncbi:uncharacterized protein CCR75_009796 [Bremia lactucae]|uniref:Uncharacterized protein n=1 Tax=Bremia lactucae TaxID=4779 RepID=A0A976FJV1_BRELC|nr:hypothetical protein CCR75_009796 [Bremia lactucae]